MIVKTEKAERKNKGYWAAGLRCLWVYLGLCFYYWVKWGSSDFAAYRVLAHECRRTVELQKRVGRAGGLSLETVEVAAEPTLQTQVLEIADIDDVFLKAQKRERKLQVAAAENHHHSSLHCKHCASIELNMSTTMRKAHYRLLKTQNPTLSLHVHISHSFCSPSVRKWITCR